MKAKVTQDQISAKKKPKLLEEEKGVEGQVETTTPKRRTKDQRKSGAFNSIDEAQPGMVKTSARQTMATQQMKYSQDVSDATQRVRKSEMIK